MKPESYFTSYHAQCNFIFIKNVSTDDLQQALISFDENAGFGLIWNRTQQEGTEVVARFWGGVRRY